MVQHMEVATEGQKQVLERRIEELEGSYQKEVQLNLDLQNKYDLMVKQKQIDTDAAGAKYELLAHERNQLRSDVDELQQ